MKPSVVLPILLCATLICGCTTAGRRGAESGAVGTVAIQIISLLGMEGNYRDARIYVGGRFVGNYEPDKTALVLPTGRQSVVIEVPRVYLRRRLPNGETTVQCYALRGQERIEILGAGNKQSLVFNSENLKARAIRDQVGP